MIVDYEIAAVLEVVDKASPVLAKVTEQARYLAKTFDALRANGATVFGTGRAAMPAQLAEMQKSIRLMNRDLPGVVKGIAQIGPASARSFGQFTKAAQASQAVLRGLNAELRDAVINTQALAEATGRYAAASRGAGRGGLAAAAAGTIARAVPVGEPYGPPPPARTRRGPPAIIPPAGPWDFARGMVPNVPALRRGSEITRFAPFIGDHGFWFGGAGPGGPGPAIGPDEALYAGSGSTSGTGPLGNGTRPTSRTRGGGRGPGGRGPGPGDFPFWGMHHGWQGVMRSSGASVPHPFNHWFSPGLAGAGALGYGLYEDIGLGDAISRIIYTAGGDMGGKSFDQSATSLRKTLLDIYTQTGMPLPEIENAAVGITRMMAPFPLAQRQSMFEPLMRAAAMETRLKGGSLEQNAESMAGLLHMAGYYDPKDIQRLLPAFTYAALFDPATITQMTRAAGYALPHLRTTMGVDPVETILGVALMQSAGISSTKAGTWLDAGYQALMPNTKNFTGTSHRKHMEALKKFGLVDANGKSTIEGPNGVEFTKGLLLMSQALKTIPKDQWSGWFNMLAGTQGARFLALASDPIMMQRSDALLKGIGDYEKRQPLFFSEYNQTSQLQQGREALAEFTRSMMDLGAVVLPAFSDAARGVTAVFQTLRTILEGAGLNGPISSHLLSWGALGLGAAAFPMGRRLMGRAGRFAGRAAGGAARGLFSSAAGGVATSMAFRLGPLATAGALGGLAYGDYSLAKDLHEKTGAPWYSFIPGASFFGAGPLDYAISAAKRDNATLGPMKAEEREEGGIASAIASAIKAVLGDVTVEMDGEAVGRLVTHHQARELERGVAGPAGYDSRMAPPVVGVQ